MCDLSIFGSGKYSDGNDVCDLSIHFRERNDVCDLSILGSGKYSDGNDVCDLCIFGTIIYIILHVPVYYFLLIEK